MYVPVMMFQIKDTLAVIPVAIICATLPELRYYGFKPTILKATTDKNERNWKLIGLHSTQDGNIKNDTNNIHTVNQYPCFIL